MVEQKVSSKRVVAVILAAGQGTRMGHPINKIFLPLHGKPIIVYAIEAFERCPSVDDILLVVAKVLRPPIDTGEVEIVLIHDGARPFISVAKVEQLIGKAREADGAILAAPLQEEECIVQVNNDHCIQRSFEGRQVWKAQTPQAFQASLLLKAYDQAERDQFYGTDTAASVERIGGRIALVESDAINLKITTADDLVLADRLSRHFSSSATA